VCFVSAAAGICCGPYLLQHNSGFSSATAQQSSTPGLSIPNVPDEVSQGAMSSIARPRRLQLPRAYNSEGLTPDEAAAAYVYEANNRSVANIATRTGAGRFQLRENPTEDAGSGFVIDHAGHVMTNFHVIEDSDRIMVTLYNGETYDARPVGVDPINDIALLKIDAPNEELFPVVITDSNLLRVGMQVFAIGNPFGLERTMTTGIISSLNRTLPVSRVRSIKSVIQIDAAINPGNSGGPLLDSQGRLIGMNTAIASRTGQNSGIGLAIPSNLISRVIPELIEHGRIIRPDIGIIQVLRTEEGLRILRLEPDGAAARAGLRGPSIKRRQSGLITFEYEDRGAADLIVGVNNKKTLKVDEFLSEIESHRPGDTVSVVIIREERPMKIDVTLTE